MHDNEGSDKKTCCWYSKYKRDPVGPLEAEIHHAPEHEIWDDRIGDLSQAVRKAWVFILAQCFAPQRRVRFQWHRHMIVSISSAASLSWSPSVTAMCDGG